MDAKGLTTWKVRPMPRAATRWGARPAIDAPCQSTSPPSSL